MALCRPVRPQFDLSLQINAARVAAVGCTLQLGRLGVDLRILQRLRSQSLGVALAVGVHLPVVASSRHRHPTGVAEPFAPLGQPLPVTFSVYVDVPIQKTLRRMVACEAVQRNIVALRAARLGAMAMV